MITLILAIHRRYLILVTNIHIILMQEFLDNIMHPKNQFYGKYVSIGKNIGSVYFYVVS